MSQALSKDQKRAIAREWKERKPAYGIYAVRCGVTGQTWVGSTRDLTAAQNGLWFTLRIGSHRDTGLQRQWDRYGESAFLYEVLEKLEEDTSPLLVASLLKERKHYWAGHHTASLLL